MAMEIIHYLPGKLHVWGSAAPDCIKPVLHKIVCHGVLRPSETARTIRSCKFYFAFENSKCTDYITEKFSGALDNFALPIVNGFKESYERVLPGTAIFPGDFSIWEELGKYLEFLLKNDTAYLEFHK